MTKSIRTAAHAPAQQGRAVIGVARSARESFPGEFIAADLADKDETSALARQVDGVFAAVGSECQPGLAAHASFAYRMRSTRFGRIINVTSLVTRGFAFRASYAAAKAALESLTRTMALELAGHGITATPSLPARQKQNYSALTTRPVAKAKLAT